MDYMIVNGELYHSDQLYHHGIKGMKWGRRRYQNADGSLTPAGVKRYAKAGYSQDSYNSNKSKAGKAYDKVTGAHKIAGDVKYSMSSKKANEARANKYLADKEAARQAKETEKYAKKGYAQDAYNSNKSKAGKAYDKVTGAHKIAGRAKYEMSSDAERKQRAEKYKAQEMTPEKIAARRKKALKIGAAVAGTALAAYGAYKLNDYVKTKNCQIAAERGRESAKKMFYDLQTSAQKNMLSNKNMVRNSVNIDVNDLARGNARAASNDSFRTAARNVINYKQSGGKLSALADLERYMNEDWFRYESRR